MKTCVVVAALAAVLVAGGCSDDPAPQEPEAAPSQTAAPAYDAALEPAAAVLALVPVDTQAVAVTDYDQVRDELGLPAVSSASPAGEQAAFWQRATAERPLLSEGLLRPVAGQLAAYGFGQLDVEWEADLLDAQGARQGWVLVFRDGTDMAQVQQAVQAGVGPLQGASVDAGNRMVSTGTTPDPTQSWAADAGLTALVGLPGNATYVAQGCLADEPAGEERITELAAYSLQFEGGIVTARLGEGRPDLVQRLRLGQADATFSAAYAGGVADPRTGRIGYLMSDPAEAARLALAGDLPFAACP